MESYFRRQCLPVLCYDPNVFVPQNRIWALMGDAVKREDDMFAWLIGGAVGAKMLHHELLSDVLDSPTLYCALKEFLRVINSEASHAVIGIVERQTDILLYTNYPETKANPGHAASQAYELALYIGLIRCFLGSSWVPKEIGLEASKVQPALKDLYPGSQILTKQAFGYFSIARKQLHHPLQSPLVYRVTETQLQYPGDCSFVDILQGLLESYVPEGHITAGFVAELMGVSTRTLHRHLQASGNTFQGIVDRIRYEGAGKLLKNTDYSIIRISQSFGFEHQTHFSRFFRRMAGQTPHQYRQRQQSIHG